MIRIRRIARMMVKNMMMMMTMILTRMRTGTWSPR